MIIYRAQDGRYLLVRKPRKEHAWQFPQGGVDADEGYEDAAKRELKEELGTDKFSGFHKSKHVLFYDFPPGYSRDNKYTGHKQSYFFVFFEGDDADIKLDREELDEYRWVYQTEIDEYLESPDYSKKINQVLTEFHHLVAVENNA